jgi:hypothetical protein
MFEEACRLETPERSIVLQTKRGTSIDNALAPAPDAAALKKQRLLVERCGVNWQERKPPAGEYNCAGQVWASRRTAVYDSAQWLWIIEDDGYRLLSDAEEPLPGDVAAYVDEERGEILHVGRVVDLRPVFHGGTRIPWALSKWSDVSGEYFHSCRDHPYELLGFKVRMAFYTDRPAAPVRQT